MFNEVIHTSQVNLYGLNLSTIILQETVYFNKVLFQESGLPLELSVKMQINMALGDLSNIANTEKFSNLVLPMLWTDIVSTYI